MTLIILGHNPGQSAVKNSLKIGDKIVEAKPFPAVIAPWGKTDDMGLGAKTTMLEADVHGVRYIGGQSAARSPLAIRQMAQGRLDNDSPIYAALAQMSFQHCQIAKYTNGEQPTLIIASALPIGWRSTEANEQLKAHIADGLHKKAAIKRIFVSSEPGAVIFHELLDDQGQIRADQKHLAKGLVCVADIGGGTMNISTLEELEMLPDQSRSPDLGSRRAIEQLRERSGVSFVDAETILRHTAATGISEHKFANVVLRQYREAVVAELQQSWLNYRPVAYLIAGGTALWVGETIKKAFGPTVRVLTDPQQAVARGLRRYATRQALKLK